MTCDLCSSNHQPFFELVNGDDEFDICGLCLIQVAEIFKGLF